MDETHRSSSPVENLNGRLRSYFFLCCELGNGYLDLLRFFLNHRTFARSGRPERVGKSPAEVMAGKPHPHWLELLGFKRFRRSPVPAYASRLHRKTIFPFLPEGAASLYLCYPKLAIFEPCQNSASVSDVVAKLVVGFMLGFP